MKLTYVVSRGPGDRRTAKDLRHVRKALDLGLDVEIAVIGEGLLFLVSQASSARGVGADNVCGEEALKSLVRAGASLVVSESSAAAYGLSIQDIEEAVPEAAVLSLGDLPR